MTKERYRGSKIQVWLVPCLTGLLLTPVYSLLGTPDDTYQQAESCVVRRDWDNGIRLLNQLLASDPLNLKVLNLMGIALTGKGKPQEGDGFFQKALNIDPEFYPARKNLAINEFTLNAKEAAERDFKLVLKSEPRDPVVHLYLGELAFSRKDCASASSHFSSAGSLLDKSTKLQVLAADCDFRTGRAPEADHRLAALDPGQLDAALAFHAGYLLGQSGQYADAVRFFERVRWEQEGSYAVAFNLGVCYVQSKRFPEAIEVLTAAKDGGPKTSELYNLLADAYEENKQTQKAINTLRQATELWPTEDRNYIDLALLCAEHKAYELGLEVVKVGLRYCPKSEGLLVQRGMIYAMTGKFELAEKDFQEAAQNDTVKGFASAGLSLAYIENSEPAKAIALLRRRTRENPNDPSLQFLLGQSLIRAGAGPGDPDFVEAQNALEKSVRLDPRFLHSRVELAKVYLKLNRIDDAIVQLQAARSIAPDEIQVYANFATAYLREGKTEDALAMLAKVRELNDWKRKHGEPIPLVRGGIDAESPGAPPVGNLN